MEELKLGSFRLKVIFDEKEYLLRRPNLGEGRELRNAIREAKTDEEHETLLLGFLEKIGLPKEVSDRMTLQDLEQVLEHVQSKKKMN